MPSAHIARPPRLQEELAEFQQLSNEIEEALSEELSSAKLDLHSAQERASAAEASAAAQLQLLKEQHQAELGKVLAAANEARESARLMRDRVRETCSRIDAEQCQGKGGTQTCGPSLPVEEATGQPPPTTLPERPTESHCRERECSEEQPDKEGALGVAGAEWQIPEFLQRSSQLGCESTNFSSRALGVFCKIVPSSGIGGVDRSALVSEDGDGRVSISGPEGGVRSFAFDKVFQPSASQVDLFSAVEPLIQEVQRGTPATVAVCSTSESDGLQVLLGGEEGDFGLLPQALHSLLDPMKTLQAAHEAVANGDLAGADSSSGLPEGPTDVQVSVSAVLVCGGAVQDVLGRLSASTAVGEPTVQYSSTFPKLVACEVDSPVQASGLLRRALEPCGGPSKPSRAGIGAPRHTFIHLEVRRARKEQASGSSGTPSSSARCAPTTELIFMHLDLGSATYRDTPPESKSQGLCEGFTYSDRVLGALFSALSWPRQRPVPVTGQGTSLRSVLAALRPTSGPVSVISLLPERPKSHVDSMRVLDSLSQMRHLPFWTPLHRSSKPEGGQDHAALSAKPSSSDSMRLCAAGVQCSLGSPDVLRSAGASGSSDSGLLDGELAELRKARTERDEARGAAKELTRQLDMATQELQSCRAAESKTQATLAAMGAAAAAMKQEKKALLAHLAKLESYLTSSKVDGAPPSTPPVHNARDPPKSKLPRPVASNQPTTSPASGSTKQTVRRKYAGHEPRRSKGPAAALNAQQRHAAAAARRAAAAEAKRAAAAKRNARHAATRQRLTGSAQKPVGVQSRQRSEPPQVIDVVVRPPASVDHADR